MAVWLTEAAADDLLSDLRRESAAATRRGEFETAMIEYERSAELEDAIAGATEAGVLLTESLELVAELHGYIG